MNKNNYSQAGIPQMLRITEIAEMYGLPVHFVRTLVNNGEVVATRVGNKILVNADRFGEYLNTNTLPAKTESADSGARLPPINLER